MRRQALSRHHRSTPFGSGLEPLEPRVLLSAVTVEAETLQEFKGFGLTPAYYDRITPTFNNGNTAFNDASWLDEPDALHDAVLGLGFDIARVPFVPELGVSPGVLDQDRLDDLVEHLDLLREHGIDRYMVTNWSPPAYMKTPDQVRWGEFSGREQTLDPWYANAVGYDYADYIVQVVRAVVDAGHDAPIAISHQNEPDLATVYASNVYLNSGGQKAVYRNVQKQLRGKLDAAGFNDIQLLGPEMSGLDSTRQLLGNFQNNGFGGFGQFKNDTAYDAAIDGIAFHTYFTSGDILEYQRAFDFHGKDLWMTEYSERGGVQPELIPELGSGLAADQMEDALAAFGRMGGDLVDFGANYWFWWRGYRMNNNGGHDGQHVVYDDPSGGYRLHKTGHALRNLWGVVGPGWTVKKVTDTDADLRSDNRALIDTDAAAQWSAPVDLIAFESPDGQRTAMVLTNRYGDDKTVDLAGLLGAEAKRYVTTTTQNAELVATDAVIDGRLEGVVLPAHSITVLETNEVYEVPIVGGGVSGPSVGEVYLPDAWDGRVAAQGPTQAFGLRDGGSVIFELLRAAEVSEIRLAQPFVASGTLKIEAEVGGAWQTIDTRVFTSATPGGFDTLAFEPIENVTRFRLTAQGGDVYFDEFDVLGALGPLPQTQTPFLGAATTVTDGATIEAEHYDFGGEGVAYHDTTSAALGDPGRDEAVDGGPRPEVSGERVGWVAAGEWLEYTVDTTAGTYDVSVRYSSGSVDGGRLRVRLGDGPDGRDWVSLGEIDLPPTGGWDEFVTGTLPGLTLPEATGKVLRLEVIEPSFDLDYLRFDRADPPPEVTDVIVSSTEWTTGFLDNLDPRYRLGYHIAAGHDATQNLPWDNLNRVSLKFSGDVRDRLSAASLSVAGVAGEPYAVADFTYDEASQIGTWTLAVPLTADRVTISLTGEASVYSANAPGGSTEPFTVGLNILPGDVDDSGRVLASDFSLMRSLLGQRIGQDRYAPEADIDGDGRILAKDLSRLRPRLGSRLPSEA